MHMPESVTNRDVVSPAPSAPWHGAREEWRPRGEEGALRFTEDSPFPVGSTPCTPWERTYWELGYQMRLLNRALHRREITGGVPRDIWNKALALLRQDGALLYFAGEEIRANRDLVEAAIRKDPRAFRHAAPVWRADPSLAQQAVRGAWWQLSYAAPNVQSDYATVMLAMSESARALCFADPAYLADAATAFVALSSAGAVLACAPQWQDDPDMVLAAVQNYGAALCAASPAQRANRHIVLAAVGQWWGALRCADPILQADPEVLATAFQQSEYGDGGQALEYATPERQNDPATVLAAVREYAGAMQYAGARPRADRQVVEAAIAQSGTWIGEAAPALQADRGLALRAIGRSAIALLSVSDTLQTDPDFLEEAVQANWMAIYFVEPAPRATVWNRAMQRHAWSELLPRGSTASPEQWQAALRERFGIAFPQRLRSLEHVHRMLGYRVRPALIRGQPLAVVLMAKTDWNDGLATYPLPERLVELGYAVLYYEVALDTDIEPTLLAATRHGRKPADLLVIGGHGWGTEAALDLGGVNRQGIFVGDVMPTDGSPVTPAAHEEEYLDWRDFEAPPQIALGRFLAPRADVVLLSCEAGTRYDAEADNLANLLSRHLPARVTVHAPARRTGLRSIERAADGTLQVRWQVKRSEYTVTSAAK